MGDTFPYIRGLQDALNRDRSEVYMGDTFPYMDTQQKHQPHSKCRRCRDGIEPYTTAASRLDHITNTTSQFFTCFLEAVATPLRHWHFDRDGCWLVDAYLSRPAAPYGRPMRVPARIQVRVTSLSSAHHAMLIFYGTHTCRILFIQQSSSDETSYKVD